MIIDADGHVTEPSALWEEFAEPAFRDRVIQVRRTAEPRAADTLIFRYAEALQ